MALNSLLRRVSLLALIIFTSARSVAWGGGFFLYETGTQDVGLASAGYGAGTVDPSTLFTNPAGMTHLEGDQLMVNLQGLVPKLQFSPDSGSTKTGTDGGQALVPLPGGSVFYEHSLTKDLKIGIGTFAYFGGALEYNLNWVGRYFLQGATIIGQSVQPTIAYRVNKWLSVGAGPIFMIGYLREKVAINNVDPNLGDGKLKLQDWALGYGGNIGVMLEPLADTRIGITYLTPVSLNFNPATNFTGLGPGLTALLLKRGLLTGSVDLGLTVPQAVTLGIFHQFNDRFAIMGNINWQQWSHFGEVEVGVNSADPKNLTTNLHYKDTGHIAIGGQYRPQDKWLLMAGFAFDSTMINESNRTVSAPIGSQYRYGLGAVYEYSKRLKLGFDYELQWWGNLSLTHGRGGDARGTVSGTFGDTFINFFCANVTYKFGMNSQTSN